MKNFEVNIDHLDKNFEFTQKFIDLVLDGVLNKRRFFLLASCRSPFILQCFATRLVHLGAELHIMTNLATLYFTNNVRNHLRANSIMKRLISNT